MTKPKSDKGYVQKRTPRPSEWTTAKRQRFLDVLAATCNASEAARSVNMTWHSANALRRRDGEFALLWADAFALGEERLREELIGAALGQVSTGYNPTGEQAAVTTAPFDAALAIKVLQLGGGRSSRRRTRTSPLPTQAEVDAALLARFDAIDRRNARLVVIDQTPDDAE